jgi:hypothetical protein
MSLCWMSLCYVHGAIMLSVAFIHCYAECHYAQCLFVMLNVIVLNVANNPFMLNVANNPLMLSVEAPSVELLSWTLGRRKELPNSHL